MSRAIITSIAGPVVQARREGAFTLGEAVTVGPHYIPGEIVRLSGATITAQVYDDTTGLSPGGTVTGSGAPLSVELGPHLLGNIFDGLLRPLRPIPEDQAYRVTPLVAAGDAVRAGQRLATVEGPSKAQALTLPPDIAAGTVTAIREGAVTARETVVTLTLPDGTSRGIGLMQAWPVRRPRPVQRRLPPDMIMVTGQRIIDSLFPVARGGRAAIPGGFGTGKTVLQETLAKWCDADVIIYVGCGERGNEMAEVLHEFPELDDPRTGRPLMERTVIVANTSNMPVAAREASIYTGVTVGEYFRDQGFHVALMADSTSRWAEALREVSGRLGELPSESGYPAYLSSRMSEFYERSARVETLGGEEGSLTIIGAVSPPAGDFSEPVTSHTKRYVRSFWGLDRGRAQARFYPAIHPLQSYSEDATGLTGWWTDHGNPNWRQQRERVLDLLEAQAELERMARIVGKDAMAPAQQLTLLCADLVDDAFLRQSAFSITDRSCSPDKQTAMLNVMMRFFDVAKTAVSRGVAVQAMAEAPFFRRLSRMGEEIDGADPAAFAALVEQMEQALATLEREASDAD
ncbi:V-type ATP synthase subunit A [Mesobacterium sp. TK19101]|uniref:V-type ATP synthase alpha chain n=1 Tax=Mesobacterium hydrothermale TaxID=3111907 RepID=A0ABU6HKH3_9RHOB|nr:V-type ATP synthase subunit A [Mesobacterium sp. TK19101]MEC3862786.1 V-type ATP synthase subunit A [Mesobacterium sp. TK19101]